jgi:hypothetical protein
MLSGSDILFSLWSNNNKHDLLKEEDLDLLELYISYCATQLNTFLGALKANASAGQWTADKSVKNKILSTTSINGLVICFRRLIEEGKTGDKDYYNTKLADIHRFDFSKFKSSQYGAMSRALYDRFFK